MDDNADLGDECHPVSQKKIDTSVLDTVIHDCNLLCDREFTIFTYNCETRIFGDILRVGCFQSPFEAPPSEPQQEAPDS